MALSGREMRPCWPRKVAVCIQYVMGHANISVTMEVYNHITDRSRIEREIAKMDLVQIM